VLPQKVPKKVPQPENGSEWRFTWTRFIYPSILLNNMAKGDVQNEHFRQKNQGHDTKISDL